jgi:hypothetical protein
MEKASLSGRKPNGISGRICLSVNLNVACKLPGLNPKKKPLAVRGVPLGVASRGQYNFNKLQMEVESIEY